MVVFLAARFFEDDPEAEHVRTLKMCGRNERSFSQEEPPTILKSHNKKRYREQLHIKKNLQEGGTCRGRSGK